MVSADYVIVGAGLTGATIARLLADAGREVLVIERRPQPGGNIQDEFHPSGIRVNNHGPHYFRTNASPIWDFVTRFGKFYPYAARVQTYADSTYHPWPLTKALVASYAGEDWRPAFHGIPANFEEACLAKMPLVLYKKFVEPYTEKQWGIPAVQLSPVLAHRLEIRTTANDSRLVRHKYQGLPGDGYSALVANMLAGIPVLFNVDYLLRRPEILCRKLLFFSGSLDEFYTFRFGALRYRGQRRKHTYYPAITSLLPCAQINNPEPQAGPHIRTIEWKHMLPQQIRRTIPGTVITTETPYTPASPDEYEYPFPDAFSAHLHKRYLAQASADSILVPCGRLGMYRYYDMDQAIAAAIHHVNARILRRGRASGRDR
jgi:UDP-galactopyranose mutase